MNPVQVIGMGLSPKDLTQAHLSLIEEADLLVGGKRHLEDFDHVEAEKRVISSPISEVMAHIQEKMPDHKVVVLASGDPLFFGIGATLVKYLGPESVVVHPNVTSMAAAFARLKMAWQNAVIVSLHGKKSLSPLKRAMDEKDLLCVLTDPSNTPSVVAEVVQNHQSPWKMWVLENLGADDERVVEVDPDLSLDEDFARLNVVVLERSLKENAPGPLRLGTPDHWFVHENGLITKADIRTVTLSHLRLEDAHILWDLGAGSGSVGLEASLFIRSGKIYSLEKNGTRVGHIQANRERFQVENLEVVQADLPEGLDALPDPDRIFIGGGGKGLAGILEAAVTRLKPQGIVVVNTVLLENISRTVEAMEGLGLTTSATQIQVSRSKAMPWGQRMEAQNPVWIITGEKG